MIPNTQHGAFTSVSTYHVSHEKKNLTFHYTGCLIGILLLDYYNPFITGVVIPFVDYLNGLSEKKKALFWYGFIIKNSRETNDGKLLRSA